jgi:opacity protein-like surface antigen
VLRRALVTCTSSLLLLAAPVFAQDDFEDPVDVLLGPSQEEDRGPDYARDGFYFQIGYSYGIASKLEEKLNGNRDKFQLEPQQTDKTKAQRDVPFTETVSGGIATRTNLSAVNPQADGDCTRFPVGDPQRCQTSPLNGPVGIVAPLSDLLLSQVGGTIRKQPIPGLRPGVYNEFLDPSTLDIEDPASAQPLPDTMANMALTTLGLQLGNADVSNSHGVNIRAGSRVLPNFAIEMQLEYMSGFEVDIPNFSRFDPADPTRRRAVPLTPPPFPAGRTVDDPVTYLRASDTDKINVELLNLTVNLKVPLLTGRIQPFALVGGGATFVFRDNEFPKRAIAPGATSSDPYKFVEYVDVRDTGAVFRLGGGIDAYVTENIYATLEYTWVAAQGEAMNDLRYHGLTAGVGYRF